MDDALGVLEKWSRKGYSYTIQSGPNYQPGDGPCVTLSAAGRKVVVDEFNLAKHDDETGEQLTYPTLAEIIHEALRLWHADESPKWFRLYVYDEERPPVGDLREWGSLSGKRWEVSIAATSEADAKRHVTAAYEVAGRAVPTLDCIYEKHGPAPVEAP